MDEGELLLLSSELGVSGETRGSSALDETVDAGGERTRTVRIRSPFPRLSELLLTNRSATKVVPEVTLTRDFSFKYPDPEGRFISSLWFLVPALYLDSRFPGEAGNGVATYGHQSRLNQDQKGRISYPAYTPFYRTVC